MVETTRIRLISPGTYTSVEGIEVPFTEADLRAAADAYDPAGDPAPLVIGHPKLDAPAYGWAARIVYEDGALQAEPDSKTLEPQFAELVRAGRYRKISPKFYLPQSPGNPKPGSLYVKHIGFLGAHAPAVKGLGTVSLGEDDSGTVTIDQPKQEANMSEKGKDEVAFAEREAELDRQKAELDRRDQELRDREASAAAAIHAGHVSFAENLVGTARLAPAAKDLVVGLLDVLASPAAVSFAASAEGTVSFGEAVGGEKIEPAAALRKLLEGASPLVSLGEAAPGGGKEEGKSGVSFAAPSGYEVDKQSLEIHAKALELQAANKDLSYIDAVKQAGG